MNSAPGPGPKIKLKKKKKKKKKIETQNTRLLDAIQTLTKSTNILLDDKYRAKVVDFGTSRTVAIDQTHLTTTLVQGTFGYLDPEYFHTCQFTEKSDVYSFGVVLVELLTGEKAVSSTTTQEVRGLATYFIYSMEKNNLFNILDARIMNKDKKEQIITVSKLAKRCLNLKGEKRPTMKEVTMKLEAIQMSQIVQQNYEEVDCARNEKFKPWDVVSTSMMLDIKCGLASSSNSQQLSSFELD